MSQSQTFTCSKCGAPQDYKGGPAPTIQCPYCDTTLIVPDSLRTGPRSSTVPAGTWGNNSAEIAEIKRLADGGNKIAAIRLYREKFGVGLKEAKDAVEAIERGQSVPMTINIGGAGGFNISPTSSGSVQVGQASSSGCMGWIIAIIVIVVVASIVIPILLSVGALAMFLPGGNNEPGLGTNIINTAVAVRSPTPRPSATPKPSATPQFANVVSEFGGKGTGAGKMSDARALAVSRTGDIFVAEYLGGRIQIFDAAGKFKTQCLIDAKVPVPALAADRKGNLYAVQATSIVKYDATTCKEIATFRPALGENYESVAVGADGTLFGTMTGNQKDTIVRFNDSGRITIVADNAVGGQADRYELDPVLTVDGQGNFYVLGRFASQVFKFDRTGKFINSFGSQGSEPGQFSALNTLAVDSQGRIYVSDNKGVQVFAPDGRYLSVFDIPVSVASGMAFDDEDNLWITARERVYKLKVGE